MGVLESLLLNQFGIFVLVLARVGSLVATAPIFGAKAAPMQIRALLAVMMTLLITPLFSANSAQADVSNLLVFGKLVLSESLLGMLLGLGVTILLTGVQLTGQIVSQIGGTGMAEGYDPLIEDNVPVYSQLFYFLTLAMFVLVDGHRLLTGALLDTYAWLPPGKAEWGKSYLDVLVMLLGQGFLLGVRAAAPAMTALLLATLVLGLIGRTLPQINILVVGFSVNALVTAAALCTSIGAIAWAFPEQSVAGIDHMIDAIRTAAGAAETLVK